MPITESVALGVVSLAMMKTELRIGQSETEHDAMIVSQIVASVSYLAAATGREGEGLLALRLAATALVRDLYDGRRNLTEDSAVHAFAEVYRSFSG